MSDIKLFRLSNGLATELQGSASDLKRPLQTLIEANLQYAETISACLIY